MRNVTSSVRSSTRTVSETASSADGSRSLASVRRLPRRVPPVAVRQSPWPYRVDGHGRRLREHRAWEKVLFDAGWSVPAWPSVYGGRDCDLIEWLIYEEEYWLSGVPGRVSANGVSLLAPTIFNFGTQEQQDFFLPRMASGEHIWAQGWRSRKRAPTSPASRPRRSSTATTSSSTDRRPGAPVVPSPTGSSASCAPTLRPSATRDSPISLCPPRRRGWNGARSAASTASRASPNSSSTTPG